VPSLSHLQSSVWTDYISDINHAAHLVSSSTALAFLQKKTCENLLPPGVNQIAVNKHINIK